MFETLWRFRYFIWASIIGELRARYARSRLGLFWSILHPLAQACIFALVLSELMGARIGGVDSKVAFPIYLMAGIAAWGLFSEIVNRCLSIFIEYAGPMKKIAFPRLCLPMIVFGGALINHLLLLAAVLIVFLFLGHLPGHAWLALPIGIALIAMFGFGLGVLLGVLNVFSRDVGQVTGVVLQIWFWLTPIVYTADILPKHLRWLAVVNPMVPLVRIYQDALLFNRWPEAATLVVPTLVALGLLGLSFVLFWRASAELVDVL